MKSERSSDSAFRTLLVLGGIAVSVLLIAIFFSLLLSSRSAIVANGFRFLTGSTWDPVTDKFQSLAFVVGTLLTSLVALVIATVLSLALAVLMGEYFRSGPFASVMRTAVELLAGIPSVVYGFIGLFFFVPAVRVLQTAVGAPPYGVGIFTSALLLAFMILPYSASIGREIISLVPSDLKEAALSLGATPSETIWKVTLPYARSGILGGVLLSLGRALGETMAVTMVIGNSNSLTLNILGPGNTMASVIANEFSEASSNVYLGSLIEIALLLFVISTLINIAGKIVVNRMAAA
ncbi:MAG TPA: phosphate ABC transporter permease subunit PstC [Spirochaetia bacterium]|nr:phosphate ABC transporter permease subunit PstC [Spirochaetia bacterium]